MPAIADQQVVREVAPTDRAAAPNLMVVDDNPKNLKLLEDMLRNCGYRVRLFPRAKMALAAAIANPPDLFLLDISMPEMDGYTLCEHLKSSQFLSEIPVIFLSALDETADKVKAFQAGAIDYITKPFQLEEVRIRIKTQIDLQQQSRLLKDNYEHLQQLESLRDSLLHMIVHDMRTPLTIIRGSLELLERSEAATLTPKGLARLDKAKNGATSLIEMVNSLLDISKLESGSMQISRVTVDLFELLRETVSTFADVSSEHSFVLPERNKTSSIQADKKLLGRVIENLLGNAVKYSPNSTEVYLASEDLIDSVRISVRDCGPVHPPEHHQRIFDKFYQVGNRKLSSGLGLAFCKLVVEAHGGTIGVESSPTKGSTFWFVLPKNPK